jgi:hypothetical protein
MAEQPPKTYQSGELSPDGQHYWDGTKWLPSVSPDGQHRWNGTAWVPNVAAAPSAPVVPAKKPGGKLKWVLGGIGALIVLGICSSAIAESGNSNKTASTSSGSDSSTTTTATTPTPKAASTPTPKASTPDPRGTCSPQPCANDNYGWIVTVSSVKYDAPSGNDYEKPEQGNVYVEMSVTFTNKLNSEQHANPLHFVLLDGAGVKHTVTFTDNCPTWDAVNVTAGGSYGPKCLVFEAVAGKPQGLTLVWTPSGFGGGYNIKLS